MHVLADAELTRILRAAQGRDQAAYGLLYARYTPLVQRYLYGRCGDSTVVEDVLGDLWVRVIQAVPRFRVPPQGVDLAWMRWLYTIGRNLLLNHQQRHGSRTVPLDGDWPARDPGLDSQVIQAEERQALHTALGRLTADQREIVVLRFFDGFSLAEVAVLTDRTEGAVKAMQHRAVAAMGRTLGIGGDDD